QYALIGLAILVLLYIVWRSTRTDRDAFARDEAVLPLLSPLAIRLAGHQDVSADEVDAVAAIPHARPVLYEMLVNYGHVDLFPAHLLTIDEQAEAILAHAVMHPNAEGQPPVAIECVSRVEKLLDDRSGEFRVLRFHMNDHSSGDASWRNAVVGPFFADAEPYLNEAIVITGSSADAFRAENLTV
ncbi:MAG: hypothetical protein H7X80_01830, partial [bacterium]|nr:hypothetical protein [Candidatus Kapabacteria bacterium]